MECPACKTHLEEKKVISKPHSLYVWECADCRGWWFKNNDLEEYRASLLSTSQYTILPNFEPTFSQAPVQCSFCKKKTLLMCNVGLQCILRCSECFGVFVSKKQVSEWLKKEEDIVVDIINEIGNHTLWAGFLSFFWR